MLLAKILWFFGHVSTPRSRLVCLQNTLTSARLESPLRSKRWFLIWILRRWLAILFINSRVSSPWLTKTSSVKRIATSTLLSLPILKLNQPILLKRKLKLILIVTTTLCSSLTCKKKSSSNRSVLAQPTMVGSASTSSVTDLMLIRTVRTMAT